MYIPRAGKGKLVTFAVSAGELLYWSYQKLPEHKKREIRQKIQQTGTEVRRKVQRRLREPKANKAGASVDDLMSALMGDTASRRSKRS